MSLEEASEIIENLLLSLSSGEHTFDQFPMDQLV